MGPKKAQKRANQTSLNSSMLRKVENWKLRRRWKMVIGR